MKDLSLKPDDGLGPVPLHVAIIMDGNGRWARARGLPRSAGHKRGAEAVRKTIEAAADLGIRYLTLFGFSAENWQRPESEVRDLMALMRFYLLNHVKELVEKGVCLRVIGDRSRLPEDTVKLIEDAEGRSADNERLVLTIALSYGSRQEIVTTVQSLVRQVQDGSLSPEDITEDLISDTLYTKDIPDPDLLIRTSGEKRLSNFLLWQAAYTEFVFTDTRWPDFNAAHLDSAVAEFRQRERRYGAVSS